jgi:septum formation protein
LGLAFEIIPSDVSEEGVEGESHETYVRRIAELKSESVAGKRRESLVIGADTTVVIGSLRLGKPASREEARKMLEMLSGKRHEVLTGVAVTCIEQKFKEVQVEKTGVWFKKLSPSRIENYILTSEPYDKAGGYGIQGGAESFIEKIEGDIFNVIGLPLERMKELLIKAGYFSPGF